MTDQTKQTPSSNPLEAEADHTKFKVVEQSDEAQRNARSRDADNSDKAADDTASDESIIADLVDSDDTIDDLDDILHDDLEDGDLKDDDDDLEDNDDDLEDGDLKDDDEPDEDGKSRKKKGSTQQRMNQLLRERREAKQEAKLEREARTALEARLAALEEKLTQPEAADTSKDDAKELVEPNPDDFQYGELDTEYTKALRAYDRDLVRQELLGRLDKDKATEDEARQQKAAEQKAQEIATQYSTTLDRGTANYDDFQEVVVDAADKGKYALSETVAMAALRSEVGDRVLYTLAKNPKMAQSIASMVTQDADGNKVDDVKRQTEAFARLERRFSKESSKGSRRASKAPQPPRRKSRGTSGKNRADPANANDFLALEKAYNSGELN